MVICDVSCNTKMRLSTLSIVALLTQCSYSIVGFKGT